MKEVISRGMTRIGQIIEVSKYDTPYYALQKQVENGLFIYFLVPIHFWKIELVVRCTYYVVPCCHLKILVRSIPVSCYLLN